VKGNLFIEEQSNSQLLKMNTVYLIAIFELLLFISIYLALVGFEGKACEIGKSQESSKSNALLGK
jgi:hypothetical protein